ncbi:hypothetical protein HK104_004098 [Borealophlyctis nickersoniae]|nr:hypothetical protein HK104_004098 [Borealophlyctis nickersoniae]
MGVFDEVVFFPGITDVPKNQRDTFIRTQRGEVQSSLRQSLSSLKETFPKEFGKISPIEDPEELEDVLEDIRKALSSQTRPSDKSDVLLPPGVAEFVLLTGGTNPDVDATFGLPTIAGGAHLKGYGEGWASIEMDFDEEIDETGEDFAFYVCVDSTTKSFGEVVIDGAKGLGKFKKVADSFEEFLGLFAEFMTGDFKGSSGDEDLKAAVEDWYFRFVE